VAALPTPPRPAPVRLDSLEPAARRIVEALLRAAAQQQARAQKARPA
jgi:hypothetical protein